MTSTIEQQRAAKAFESVKSIKGKVFEEKYKALASGAPADIQINGLGQTLAFWKAKANKPQLNEHKALYQHVADWVKERLQKEGATLPANTDLLEWLMQTATTEQYRRATAETSALLLWLKRFAEAELKGDVSQGKSEA